MITKICPISKTDFIVSDEDIKFYEKLGVPVPNISPEERTRHRFAFRNERTLYKDKCARCESGMISMYRPGQDVPIYCQDCWWSDRWDSQDYAQDIDEKLDFFEQFKNLLNQVPRFNLRNRHMENCDYSNFGVANKNGYLCFSSWQCEDFYYSDYCISDKDVFDCTGTDKSELCYECTDCQNCFEVFFSQHSEQCRHSYFLKNCRNCEHCFGCMNLRNQKYQIFNKQVTREAYENFVSETFPLTSQKVSELKSQFLDFQRTQINRETPNINCEDCEGSYLDHSQNCTESLDLVECQDCRFCIGNLKLKDCQDVGMSMATEIAYNSVGIGNSFEIRCSCWLDQCRHVDYSFWLINCEHCFGCVGLRNAQYCIFNKQYSKEEYFKRRDKLIKQMKENNTWGQFFPKDLSPFAYNETIAHAWYPLSKARAKEKDYQWIETKTDEPLEAPKTHYCQSCQKNYRLIEQELEFYDRYQLPLPTNCPNCRYKTRQVLRNPRRLWDRDCAICAKSMRVTFSPERPEKVYCEACFLKEVY